MRPNGNRVIIEILPETHNLLFIISEAKDKPLRGVVTASGADEVAVGQIVWVNRFAGDDFKFDGKQHKIIRAESILLFE